jgi:hypothetical protein
MDTKVREIDLIAMLSHGVAFPSGDDYRLPAPPTVGSLPRGLSVRRLVRGGSFVLVRFTWKTSVSLRIDDLRA